jgi:formylglycine-generating enzyme required for sulfatase activity/serine/threonine protein kinase
MISSSNAPDPKGLVGKVLDNGRYLVVRHLGGGGMKEVYLAEDTRFSARRCALAILSADFPDAKAQQDAVSYFQREADLLAQLDHVHIVRVLDRFSEGQERYLVMEYVQGETLEQRLKQIPGGRLSASVVVRFAIQVLDALEYLHSQKPVIIYRDLKPGNIMITMQGRVKLIDFGIARFLAPTGGKGTMMGTIGYAPPEQYRGLAETRSDLYALGATMHHLLSGQDPQDPQRRPFDYAPLGDLCPGIDARLAELVREALEFDIDRRVESAREFKRRLEHLQATAKAPSVPQPTPTNAPPAPSPADSATVLIDTSQASAQSAASSQSQPQPAALTCPGCHKPLPPNAKFCPFCTTVIHINNGPTKDASEGATTTTIPIPVNCTNCGQPTSANTSLCSNCGARLTPAPAPTPITCPGCHKSIPPDARFCPFCTRVIQIAKDPKRGRRRWFLLAFLLVTLAGFVALAGFVPIGGYNLIQWSILRWGKLLVPEMVVIHAGRFSMGSPVSEPGHDKFEGPQQQVTINYTFAVSKYPVTRDEYAQFVVATGYSTDTEWRDPGFSQTGRDPVVGITWNDAKAYVTWLRHKTGKPYRLLSEAEYEYAERAGTTTVYWWGDDAGDVCLHANASECHHNSTVPVGSYAPNAFGLYDMSGNVWDWTEDCWNESLSGAPDDGSVWTSGDCSQRVMRGGSWWNDAGMLRSAFRINGNPSGRSGMGGFRVAITLGKTVPEAASKTSGPTYSVQLDEILDWDAAQQLARSITEKGFDAYIVKAKATSKDRYRVRIGHYATAEQAALAESTLHKQFDKSSH